MNPATDAKRPRRLEPVVEFVTLKGGVTIPVPELRLALDLEARGIPLATDADRQFVVPKDERLTTDDLVNIPRWRAGVLKPSTVH